MGRQIWEIFIYLDVDSVGKIHIGDICDLVLRVLRENGHVETEQNIKEWFCEEILIDFWSFFAAIVENYSGLLKVRRTGREHKRKQSNATQFSQNGQNWLYVLQRLLIMDTSLIRTLSYCPKGDLLLSFLIRTPH